LRLCLYLINELSYITAHLLHPQLALDRSVCSQGFLTQILQIDTALQNALRSLLLCALCNISMLLYTCTPGQFFSYACSGCSDLSSGGIPMYFLAYLDFECGPGQDYNLHLSNYLPVHWITLLTQHFFIS